MKAYLRNILLFIGLWSGFTSSGLAQSKSAFTLEIIPQTYSGTYSDSTSFGGVIVLEGGHHFYVLLTNTSSTELVFFEEWNSWGYFNLSFEITYPDGRKATASKAIRYWPKNFPSTFSIAPHGYHVFEVDFGKEWMISVQGTPVSNSGTYKGIACRMRAIYKNEVAKTDFPSTEQVWTGTISSENKPYTVWP